jgi:hypothetical protein
VLFSEEFIIFTKISTVSEYKTSLFRAESLQIMGMRKATSQGLIGM